MSEVAQPVTGGSPADVPTPPPAEPAAKQTTTYLVLVKGPSESWNVGGSYSGASAKAAVSAYVKDKDAKEGTFVAVPARSWNPLTLKVETQPKITLT